MPEMKTNYKIKTQMIKLLKLVNQDLDKLYAWSILQTIKVYLERGK